MPHIRQLVQTVSMLPTEEEEYRKMRLPAHSTKIYRRRWWIIFVYTCIATSSAFQWMQFTIISNIIERYYNVTSSHVNWTSIVYMILYMVSFIPISFITNTRGLRVSVLTGAILVFLGAAVKLFALRQDYFYLLLLGQMFAAMSQAFTISLPTKIAAVWFKPTEAALACTIGANATQLGLALGFVIPTSIVKNHANLEDIAFNLKILYWGQAIFMLTILIATIIYFPKHPPLPPTYVQAEGRLKKTVTVLEFLSSFGRLLKLKGFIFHVIAYGICTGVLESVGTFLNQLVLYYFPNSEEDAGRMGLLIVTTGTVSMLVFGVFLDRTHRYKETALFNYYSTLISVLVFVGTLQLQDKILTYFAAMLFGICINPYISVGFELAVEVTFPIEESTTIGILNASCQIFGILCCISLEKLYEHFGPIWGLANQSLLLIIGIILTHLVPNEKRRQRAFQQDACQHGKLLQNGE